MLGRVCKLQTGCLCSQRIRSVVIDMAQNTSLVQRTEPVERLFGKANLHVLWEKGSNTLSSV